jgi:tRNA (cmo5U34)-methyltransferase
MEKDNIIAEGSWQFDENVTSAFDDMLARSIPGYTQMRDLVTTLGVHFARPETLVVDLGCSRGGSLAPLVDALGPRFRFLGIEVSNPMRSAAVERFRDQGDYVEIANLDLRESYPAGHASVVLSILTLQFIPIEYRQEIVQKVYDSLMPNGAFILVEKVLGSDSEMNSLLINQYLSLKGQNGYTVEQINAKRKALEGVLVPVTGRWNEDLLSLAGFSHIECFWRHLNFSGWLAIKK